MKKVVALVLTAVMMVATLSAFAINLNEGAGENTGITRSETNEFLTNPTFISTPEDKISVGGLDAGDTVTYYRLLQWKETFTSSEAVDPDRYGWELTEDGNTAGVSVKDLLDGINAEEAAQIAKNLANTAGSSPTEVTSSTWEEGVEPGLYYIKVVAGDPDTIYNPIFVSADYYDGNNSITVSENDKPYIGNSSVVKKAKVPFDKDAVENDEQTDKFNDVAPGDVIDYQITTKIPAFGANYTNAQFDIADEFVGPITLVNDSIVVKCDNVDVTDETSIVTVTPSSKGFTIVFKKDYLINETRGVTDVVITYSGKVKDYVKDDPEWKNSVTVMDNTVKLTFSNSPTTTTDKDDITRHYTFAIDGEALGQSGTFTSELIKVGIDQNGDPVTSETVTYRANSEAKSPLAGAKFTLVGESDDGVTISREVTTGADGRIHFEGLDAGEYTLSETEAPAGFVRDTTTYKVKIEAFYLTDGTNDDDVADVLDYYTVTITNNKSGENGKATFTSTSETLVKVGVASEEVQSTWAASENMNGFVQNRQGNELPSTGGIGTTLFYIFGGIMVIAAGVILVARRKAEE